MGMGRVEVDTLSMEMGKCLLKNKIKSKYMNTPQEEVRCNFLVV